jgi:hypothetical protein
MCHAESDEVVAIANAQMVYAAMTSRGADVSLVVIPSSDSCGSHTGCAPLCLKSALTGACCCAVRYASHAFSPC